METVRPGDRSYDSVRSLFNAMVDRRPAVVARCHTPADVAEALALARLHGYPVAVRAGGHSVAGMSTNDEGLVIDVRPMAGISVDTDRQTVRVGAGVTWGALDQATQRHGLATTGGRVSSTGVAGFTLGGGSGWLERSYGLACDNLRSVDLVTADGRRVTASATEHPELFWALHGGGGNFGVATAFELDLHPVGPTVYAALAAWPEERVGEVALAFRDWGAEVAEPFSAWLMVITAPPEEWVPPDLVGRPVALVAGLWAGASVEDGARAFAPMLALRPALDLSGPWQYTDFQCALDDVPGNRHYWSADYHAAFPDETVEAFVRSGANRPSPLDQQILLRWGGAVARVPAGATPLDRRGADWITHPFAVWQDPADDGANIEWVRDFRRAVAPYALGRTYLNFIGDEGQDRVRAAFGDTYDRLAGVKAQWDPGNVFGGNQNIRPR